MPLERKNLFVLAVIALYLLSLIFIFFPQITLVGSAIIDGLATFGSASVSITIISSATGTAAPASGNVNFSDAEVNEMITNITGVESGKLVNVTLHGSGFPSTWTEPEPNSSEVKTTRIEYFEVVMNYNTSGGSYIVFFNVTQAKLGSIPAANISLFIFETNWTNLSTTVISGSSDPARFSAVTTHFSKFLIGQRITEGGGAGGEEGGGEAGPSGPSGGGGGGGGGGGAAKKKPAAPPEEVLEDIEEKLPEPVHKPGVLFDVSVNIPEQYRKVLPGKELVAEVHAINIKGIGSVTVKVEYTVENKEGEVLFQEIETKVVENEIKYLKEVTLPADIRPGAYMFFVNVKYEDDAALAGYPFKIMEEKKPLFGLAIPLLSYKQAFKDYGVYLVGFAVLILVLLVLIRFAKRKRIPKLVYIREKS